MDFIEVDEGTTDRALFKREVPHREPEGYLIRVNSQPAATDQVIQNLDRVSFTATKIEGARFLRLELVYLLPAPCPLTQETPCQL